ncbi:MAG: TonB-dependent receptor [Gammaproteobacteria bacterium]|nr:TonB-dependent receptor [Gammaproteobacteria bacterium]
MPALLRLSPLTVALFLALPSSVCRAEEADDEEALAALYGDAEMVSIATGTATPVARAPSVASVITADDIEAMGARNLEEALESVPGLHVSRSGEAMAPRYFFRGITSKYNAQTLVLVNGTPLTSVVRGDRGIVWGSFPVHGIARIEIIRGPGSALYGADAFAGVINIITKAYDNIRNGAGISAGSFSSQGAWLEAKTEVAGWRPALSLEYQRSDGHDEAIDSDAQSLLDALQLAPAASHAPDGPNTGYEALDAWLDVSNDRWHGRAGYQKRNDVGTGQGIASALDPHGKFGSERILAELAYDSKDVAKDWELSAKGSYLRTTQNIESDLNLLPPGTLFGLYPNGIIGNPEYFEQTSRLELNAFYTGLLEHRIRIGAGYHYGDVYKTKETKNFATDLSPLPGLVDVSDTAAVYLPEKSRDGHFVFVQDEWQVAPDWQMTLGVRHDRYSDFGSTTNPRFALVWTTSQRLTSKLLYGKAFRAPSFGELYAVNNPVSRGNLALQPEVLTSYELAFSYQFDMPLTIDANVFRYEIDDIIDFIPDVGQPTLTAQNANSRKGNGLEIEARYKFNDNLQLHASYSTQDAEDRDTGEAAGVAPDNKLYARMDWRFHDEWHLVGQWMRVGERAREANDPRKSLEGYASTDLILRRDAVASGKFGFSAGIYNAFDESILEPSLGPSAGSNAINIPGDLPQAGRTYHASISYTF